MDNSAAATAMLKAAARRRRHTLPPNGLSPVQGSRSPEGIAGTSRFACLLDEEGCPREEGGSDGDDCLSEVPFDSALDVLVEDAVDEVPRRGLDDGCEEISAV